MIEEPKDFLGYLLYRLINKQLEDHNVKSDVEKWNMIVVLNTNYYPVTISFKNGFRIKKGAKQNPTLSIAFSLDTVIRLAMSETSILKAVLSREIKVGGILRHPLAAKKFYGLLSSILRG